MSVSNNYMRDERDLSRRNGEKKMHTLKELGKLSPVHLSDFDCDPA